MLNKYVFCYRTCNNMHNMLPSVRPSVPEQCPSTARADCPSSPSSPNCPSTARALPERCLTRLDGRDVLLLANLIFKNVMFKDCTRHLQEIHCFHMICEEIFKNK